MARLSRLTVGLLLLKLPLHGLDARRETFVALGSGELHRLDGRRHGLIELASRCHADRLLDALEELRAKGNTLVVVEHDIDTMLRADRLVDIGPGAGKLGGQIMAQGTVAELKKDKNSLTGRYLKNPIPHLLQPRRPVDARAPMLGIRAARLHNIDGLDVNIPLGRLVASLEKAWARLRNISA